MATLQRGAQGKAVKELQELLLKWHEGPVPAGFRVNSVFDNATETSLKAYQEGMLLAQTGKATPVCMALLRGNTMHVRADIKPASSKQTRGQFTCWAHASYSYFLTTKNTLRDHDPEFWIDFMGSKGLTSTLDGLSPIGWEYMAKYAGLDGKIYTASADRELKTRAPRHLLGADVLYDVVAKHGYAILVYNLTASDNNPVAHAVVLYGVSLEPGQDDHLILIMDPMTGFQKSIYYGHIDKPVVALLWNRYYKTSKISQGSNGPFQVDDPQF